MFAAICDPIRTGVLGPDAGRYDAVALAPGEHSATHAPGSIEQRGNCATCTPVPGCPARQDPRYFVTQAWQVWRAGMTGGNTWPWRMKASTWGFPSWAIAVTASLGAASLFSTAQNWARQTARFFLRFIATSSAGLGSVN